jgi:hypothetical protein
MYMDSNVVVTITIAADPRVLSEAVRVFFPSFPSPAALPLPTMQAPPRPAPPPVSTGSAAKPSAPVKAKSSGIKQPLTEQKSCAWCGNKFQARAGQLYHDTACAQKAKKHRATERAIEQTAEQNGRAAA